MRRSGDEINDMNAEETTREEENSMEEENVEEENAVEVKSELCWNEIKSRGCVERMY